MATSDGDNSSANLSLKLRHGSSDSRESFYMDFDRGIDSDIEEVSSKPRSSTLVGSVVVEALENDYSDDEVFIELRERKILVSTPAGKCPNNNRFGGFSLVLSHLHPLYVYWNAYTGIQSYFF